MKIFCEKVKPGTRFLTEVFHIGVRNIPKCVIKHTILITNLNTENIQCFPRANGYLKFLVPFWSQSLVSDLGSESVRTELTFHIWDSKPCNRTPVINGRTLSHNTYKEEFQQYNNTNRLKQKQSLKGFQLLV